MNVILISLCLLVNLVKYPVDATLTEIIQTTKGPIQGEILTTVQKHVEYSSFRGIPFGKPPTGERRFKSPEEVEPWGTPLLATSDPNICPQSVSLFTTEFSGNEDCLYLNVYVPKTKFNESDELLPVMVWIYGGRFASGSVNSSKYGPDFFIEEGVILAAMNYRLGPFGFLAVNHPDATGNAGLKDQVLALRWIQQNIKNFGGDPAQVTIFGESAGGISVDYHKISDVSDGLFSKSISMSGSALSSLGVYSAAVAESRALYLGRNLGINTTSKSELLKHLYAASAEDIVNAFNRMNLCSVRALPTVEDPAIANDEVFLSEYPIDRFKSKNFRDLPHMLGISHREVLLYASTLKIFKTVIRLSQTVVKQLNLPPQNFSDIFDPVLNTSEEKVENIDPSIIYPAIRASTDLIFTVGADATQRYLSAGSSPVYYYRNSFTYDNPWHKLEGSVFEGAAHYDDVFELFWLTDRGQSLDPESELSIFRKKLVKLWTNFAKYGNPTPDGTDDLLLNVTWTPSGEAGLHLELGSTLTMGGRITNAIVDEGWKNAGKKPEERKNG